MGHIRNRVRRDLPGHPFMSVDTNEQCQSPEYIIEYLNKVKEKEIDVFNEILYIEQPTERNLKAHSWNMGEITKLKPVIIDESLTSVEDFKLAREYGWSGIALKSCKCLSSDLIFVPLAELSGIPYTVQDLTNPSIALIESIGLAARIHTIKGVEANSRQFFPMANEPESKVHPELYNIKNGVAKTTSIIGTGLGFQIERINRDIFKKD